MRAVIWLVFAVAAGRCSALAFAQDNWVGEAVFPKEANSKLRTQPVEGGPVTESKWHQVPGRVDRVEGDSLWIVASKSKGYAKKSEVVTLGNAITFFSERIRINPNDAYAYSCRAIAWYFRKDFDKAIADYDEAIRLEPNVALTYTNRGIAWSDKGDYDKAIADYSRAIRLDPNDARTYINRGSAWTAKNDYDKAIADYTKAIQLDPTNATSHHTRGVVWRYKEDYDRAIADFDAAIRIDPNNGWTFHNRGRAWHLKAEYDQAIADFDAAIRLEPNEATMHYHRGLAWRGKADYDRAIADFDEVLRLEPQEPQAHLQRGMSWAEKDDFDKAIADYNEAIRLDPNDASAFYNRGIAWRNKMDFGKAIADYSAAIRLDPEDVAFHNELAWVLATCPDGGSRNGKRAVQAGKRACELTEWNEPDYLDTLAAAYAETGDFAEAIKYQEKSLELAEATGFRERLALYRDGKPYRIGTAETVVQGNSAFAFDLYGRFRPRAGNLFFSPYSVSTALAMTYGGAAGSTQAEMATTLHFAPNQEETHAAFADLIGRLQWGGSTRPYELNVANALWGHKDCELRTAYLSRVKDSYRAMLLRLDFAGATDEARSTINRWVEDQTNQKIKELLKPGMVDNQTQLVLTNAIYFKAAWAEPFSAQATRPEDFFATPDTKFKVPMMHQTEKFRYLDGGSFQLLELPYQANALSMLVLLPKKVDGLETLQDGLSASALAQWVKRLETYQVQVALPRFKLTFETLLNDDLIDLGMRAAFDRDKADFSRMTGQRGGFYISVVVHQAFVDVDERGTEAAAATAVVMAPGAGREPPNLKKAVFRADHPFVFLIRENATGSILFMGRFSKT